MRTSADDRASLPARAGPLAREVLMRRRRFMDLAGASGWRRLAIIAAGSFALAIPSTAGAQPISRIPRIGYLAAVPTANTALLDALRAELGTLDWVEGRNFIVEYRWSHERDELLPDLAADLVRLGVNLIVVPAPTYAVAALRFTRTIPIVFCSHGDPVGAGHVASLARPGGNVTGISNLLTDLSTKQLELLVEAAPGARRIAVLWSPAETFHAPALPAVQAAARALQVEVRFVQVRGIEDFDAAFAQMSAEQVGAFLALVTPPISFTALAWPSWRCGTACRACSAGASIRRWAGLSATDPTSRICFAAARLTWTR